MSGIGINQIDNEENCALKNKSIDITFFNMPDESFLNPRWNSANKHMVEYVIIHMYRLIG